MSIKRATMLNAADGTAPIHYQLTRAQFSFSLLSIATAFLLLGALGFRIATELDLWTWWVPLTLLGGVAAADFGSGLVHWGADTWGRDDLPIVGHRLLVPFRVHHLNPDDFLRRRFVDTNGDVAFIAVPVCIGLLLVPMTTRWGGAAVVFGFGFCGIGMLTNQIHQWAHMSSPPRVIRALQDCGLILGRDAHAVHHERPYDVHYCITTGWCNRPLEGVAFFSRLEHFVTQVTGARPREDDRRYELRFGGREPQAHV
jgi:hypothetical protein